MAKEKPSSTADPVVATLCPNCALCCNGVLFKDVELQKGDNADKLKNLGLPISNSRSALRGSGSKPSRFPQPCSALEGCHCNVYADRPLRCRQFECALFKSVAVGETGVEGALGIIRDARKRAERVKALLRELGDSEESLALSLRFKRARRRFENSDVDESTAETFSRLTLAVHDLNLLLHDKFYPPLS
jgi:Fe-S-cluster containining protein